MSERKATDSAVIVLHIPSRLAASLTRGMPHTPPLRDGFAAAAALTAEGVGFAYGVRVAARIVGILGVAIAVLGTSLAAVGSVGDGAIVAGAGAALCLAGALLVTLCVTLMTTADEISGDAVVVHIQMVLGRSNVSIARARTFAKQVGRGEPWPDMSSCLLSLRERMQ